MTLGSTSRPATSRPPCLSRKPNARVATACAFLDGVQFDNTTCISLLYETIVVCTNVIHDAKEQCVTHLILMTKEPIVVDWMFCKIISHNLAMANFALLSYI